MSGAAGPPGPLLPPPTSPDVPEEARAPEVLAPADHGVAHQAQHTTAPAGRWCPYCGADLSGVPERENQDEAMFAVAGRRLKITIAVVFVVIWLGASMYDFVNDPGANLLPGWFSALGAVLLFYLLGVSPWGLLRRR